MLDEGGKPRRHGLGQALLAGVAEGTGEEQRTGVVVDAVAMRAIGHGMDGVLKQAGIVAHAMEVLGSQFWRSRWLREWPCLRQPGDHGQNAATARRLECREVARCGLLPCHGTAASVGAQPHGLSSRAVGQ